MLDEKGILKRLRGMNAKTVLVQVPEGLKARAAGISGMLEENGISSIISVDPCFGACDLRDSEAGELGCDALLHIGHSGLGLETKVPVVFDEYQVDFDPVIPLRKGLARMKMFKAIGLVTTVQHVGSLERAKKFLEKQGHPVFIGKSERLGKGQILGCDLNAAESIASQVDCFLYIGSGIFHPLGLVGRTEKPVLFLDVENGDIRDVSPEKDKMEISRSLRIEKARGMDRYAVFVSTKPGQTNAKEAFRIKEDLKRKGKSAFIVSADRLTRGKIMGMGIEVLVNTACPRIYDDQKSFGVVVLNPDDVGLL